LYIVGWAILLYVKDWWFLSTASAKIMLIVQGYEILAFDMAILQLIAQECRSEFVHQ